MRARLIVLRALMGSSVIGMLSAAPARADQVVDWNQAALRVATAAQIVSGAVQARILAMMHVAIHDALNAIDQRYNVYAVTAAPSPTASPAAAVAAAAHGVLSRLFPANAALLDSPYQAALAAIPDGPPRSAGLALGDRVAAQIVSLRSADGFGGILTYSWRPAAPGVFQPVPPAHSLTAVGAGLPLATPFTLTHAAQFRPGGPPALTSAEYTRDFDEVRHLGAHDSRTRTAEQTATAHFWREQSMAQAWNRIARPIAAARSPDLWESARHFALLNLAIADIAITVFETKYHYHFWRPVTAIHQADADGNDATVANPTWEPLLPTPSHPEYPSGHAGYCAAAASVLAFVFGDQTPFTATSPTALPADSARSFTSFSRAAEECAEARVYAGIHFRTACEHAAQQGRQVGHWTTQRILMPRQSR